jgi:sugar phosphate isomerase/epimerase
MKYGICHEHFADRPFDAAIDLFAELGYDGVEVTPWPVVDSPRFAPNAETERIRTTIESAGLDVIGVPRVFSAADTEYHIGHPDPDVRERTVAYLRDVVRFCAAIGGGLVLYGSPVQRNVPEDVPHDRIYGNTLESFRDPALLELLESTDVTLCMEPISPGYSNFITDAGAAVEFVERVDHPNVGVALDGFHLAREDRSPSACIREAGPHLAHVHSDGDTGRGAAAGTLEYGPILETLSEIGYDGYLSLEIHECIFDEVSEPLDPAVVAEESLAYLRSLA